MDMQTIERLEKRLCKELDEIAGKDKFSSGDLDVVDKATHSIKSMEAIKGMSEGGYSHCDGGYSQRGGRWEAQGGYSGYDDGMYGGTSQRTRRNGDNGGGYSQRRRRGYSGADGAEDLRHKLRESMDTGELTPDQREAARDLMEALER